MPAILLSLLFFATNCVFANVAESNFWKERKKAIKLTRLPSPHLGGSGSLFIDKFPQLKPPSSIKALPKRIQEGLPSKIDPALKSLLTDIPYQYGSIRKVNIPKNPNGKIILQIQDVHMNHEAQTNIGNMVEELIKKDQLDLIALEGHHGDFKLKPFQHYSNKAVVKKVANFLIQSNKITGPIYVGLTSQYNTPPIIGVDDPLHYGANIEAYRKSSMHMDAYQKQGIETEKELEKEKNDVFNSNLKEFDKRVGEYRNGLLSLGRFVQLIAQSSSLDEYPAAKIFVEAFTLESRMDFRKLELERSRLITKLVENLDEKTLSELTANSIAYRTNQMHHADFYRYLQKICLQNKVSLDQFKNMNSYIRYVLLSAQIDPQKLFAELRHLEERKYAEKIQNLHERTLVHKSRQLHLTKKLIDFSLTREEWAEYSKGENSSAFDHQQMSLASFEKFYEEAILRDKAISENLVELMKKGESRIAVLVTGGFHSKGIEEHLDERGFTSIQFAPRIERVNTEKGTAYLSVFTQEKTPIEKLFGGQKLFLTYNPFSPVIRFETAGTIPAEELWSAPDRERISQIFAKLAPGFADQIRVVKVSGGGLDSVVEISFIKNNEDVVEPIQLRIQKDRRGDIASIQQVEEGAEAYEPHAWQLVLVALYRQIYRIKWLGFVAPVLEWPLYRLLPKNGQSYLFWLLVLHPNQTLNDVLKHWIGLHVISHATLKAGQKHVNRFLSWLDSEWANMLAHWEINRILPEAPQQITGLLNENETQVYVEDQDVVISVEQRKFEHSQAMSDVSTLRMSSRNTRMRVMPMEEAMNRLSIYNRSHGNTRQWRTGQGADEVITDSSEIRSQFRSYQAYIDDVIDQESEAGWEFFTLFDNSNTFGNPNYIAFVDGLIYHGTGMEGQDEFVQDFDKPFLSLVQYPDGHVEMDEIYYEIDEEESGWTENYIYQKRAKAYKVDRISPDVWTTGEELKGIQAFNGVPVLRDGESLDMKRIIRSGYFSDFRHVVHVHALKPDGLDFISDRQRREKIEAALKTVKAGLYFGSDQLNDNSFRKLAEAIDSPVTLKNHLMVSVNGTSEKVPLTRAEVKELFEREDYQEVTHEPQKPGEFRLVGLDSVDVFFKPNPYPMLLYGETNTGEIVISAQAIGGASGQTGITLREIPAWAEEHNIQTLFIGSQGTGSLSNYAPQGHRTKGSLKLESVVKGSEIAPGSQKERRTTSCAICFLVKRDPAKLYNKVRDQLAEMEFEEEGFGAVREKLVEGIGQSYHLFFTRVADFLYDVHKALGSLVHRGPDHHEEVEKTYQHSLDVIASVAQLFSVVEGKNPPAEKKGLGRLSLAHEEQASTSFDNLRRLMDSLSDDAKPEAMNYLLETALLHDTAKYGELLNPSKPHEIYAYEVLKEREYDVSRMVNEIIRLHVHFGITYNGEFNPQILIDEINHLWNEGWKEGEIKTLMTLTAVFTLADVTAYGYVTNTMVDQLTEMVLGNHDQSGLSFIIETLNQPSVCQNLSSKFVDVYAAQMQVGLLRFGDLEVDNYPRDHFEREIERAKQETTSGTNWKVDTDDWKVLERIGEIFEFRYVNNLIKAIRLTSIPAAINFMRLIVKAALLLKQSRVVFVGAHGQPINKVGDLTIFLRNLIRHLPYATDIRSDDHRTYYLVGSDKRRLPDSPSIMVTKVQEKDTMVVRFPFFISKKIKDVVDLGGDIEVTPSLRERYLVNLTSDIMTPYGVTIPTDPLNTYQQTFNPLTSMVIAQSIVNVRKPKRVIVTADSSVWAKEHARYISGVLAGNDVEVVLFSRTMPLGVPAGLIQQQPGLADMVLHLNAGAGGRNFGFGIYTKDGSLSSGELRSIFAADGGIGDYLSGKENELHLRPSSMPTKKSSRKIDAFNYLLPEIDLGKTQSTTLWFSDPEIMDSMEDSFEAAYGSDWWHKLNVGVVHEQSPIGPFDNSSYLNDDKRAFSSTLQNRPDTTAIMLNANGSRFGLAEKVPTSVGEQLEALGAEIIRDDTYPDTVIVHYPPFLIWTMIAALYADEHEKNGDNKAFAGTFPTSENVRRIAQARRLEYLPSDIGEPALKAVINDYEGRDDHNRTLISFESSGNGNGWLSNREVDRIERQNNPFAMAMMLLHFDPAVKADYHSFGEYLLSVPTEFNINLSQVRQTNVLESQVSDGARLLQEIEEGQSLGDFKVERIEQYSEVTRGRRIYLDKGAVVSFYFSYKSKTAEDPTIRIFVDAPNQEVISQVESAIGLSSNGVGLGLGVIPFVKNIILRNFPVLERNYDTDTAPLIEEILLPTFFILAVFLGAFGMDMFMGTGLIRFLTSNSPGSIVVLNALYRVGFILAHPKSERGPPLIAFMNFVVTSLPVYIGLLLSLPTVTIILLTMISVLLATILHVDWNLREKAREMGLVKTDEPSSEPYLISPGLFGMSPTGGSRTKGPGKYLFGLRNLLGRMAMVWMVPSGSTDTPEKADRGDDVGSISLPELYKKVYDPLTDIQFDDWDFQSIRQKLVDTIGESYLALFNATAQVQYQAFRDQGGQKEWNDDHQEKVVKEYNHSLDVLATVVQFKAIMDGTDYEPGEKGFGLLATRHERRSKESFQHIRTLLNRLSPNVDVSLDYMLQTCILHDVAKYGEYLNPAKGHEENGHKLIVAERIDIPDISKEMVRLHVHFGITYNGEFHPQKLVDEVLYFHKKPWEKEDIKTLMALTALFTIADVTAYSPVTNTQVEKLVEMASGNDEHGGLFEIIDVVDKPLERRGLIRKFNKRFSDQTIIGLLRFGNKEVDGYDEDHYPRLIKGAMETVTNRTDGIVGKKEWGLLKAISDLRDLRQANYLIKSMRLKPENIPGTLNFIRLVIKTALTTQQTNLVFVSAEGRPIPSAGDLTELLKDLINDLPLATDIQSDDHQSYYLVDSANNRLPDSPLMFVRDVEGQNTLVVRFPHFIDPKLKEALEYGGKITLSQEIREQYLAPLSDSIVTPYNLTIPLGVNLFEQPFNPLTTLAITQSVVNVREPVKVTVAGDSSSWATEHKRYIAGVLEGNGIKVKNIEGAVPAGKAPSHLNRKSDPRELVIYVSEGMGSPNFRVEIYDKFGPLSREKLEDLYHNDGGIKSFVDGHSDTILYTTPSPPESVAYHLPEIRIRDRDSTAIWFADDRLIGSLHQSLAKAYDEEWWKVLRIGTVHRDRQFNSFGSGSYLTEGKRPFSKTLLSRPETTFIMLNAPGSRFGLAEKIPSQYASQLEDLGAVVVDQDRSRESVIVHYPPHLIWTILAALYADQYAFEAQGKTFVGSFPVSSNIERLGRKRGIPYISTDVGEHHIAKAVSIHELSSKNKTLLFCEPNGKGNVFMMDPAVPHINKQDVPFDVAMMLFHFSQTIKPKHKSLAEYLLSIPSSFSTKLYQYEEVNRKADEVDSQVKGFQGLEEGAMVGRFTVKSVEKYSAVTNGQKATFSDGLTISMYFSYKGSKEPTVRFYFDAPTKEMIEEAKQELGLKTQKTKKRRTDKAVIPVVKEWVTEFYPSLEKNYDTRTGPVLEEIILPMLFTFMIFLIGADVASLQFLLSSTPILWETFANWLVTSPGVSYSVINTLYRIVFVKVHPKGDRRPLLVALVNFIITSLPVLVGEYLNWSIFAILSLTIGAVVLATLFHAALNPRQEAQEIGFHLAAGGLPRPGYPVGANLGSRLVRDLNKLRPIDWGSDLHRHLLWIIKAGWLRGGQWSLHLNQPTNNIIEFLTKNEFEEDEYYSLIVVLGHIKEAFPESKSYGSDKYRGDDYLYQIDRLLSVVIYKVGKGLLPHDRQKKFRELTDRLGLISDRRVRKNLSALSDMDAWERHFGHGWHHASKFEDHQSGELAETTNYVYQRIMELKDWLIRLKVGQTKLWDDPLSLFDQKGDELKEAGINFVPETLRDEDLLQFQLAFLEKAAKEGFNDILVFNAHKYLGLPYRDLRNAIGQLTLSRVEEFVSKSIPDRANDGDLLKELRELIRYKEPKLTEFGHPRDSKEEELNHKFIVGLRKIKSRYGANIQFSMGLDKANNGGDQHLLRSVLDKSQVVAFGRLPSNYMDWRYPNRKRFVEVHHRQLANKDQGVYDYHDQERAVLSVLNHHVHVDQVDVPGPLRTLGLSIKENDELLGMFENSPTRYNHPNPLKNMDYMMVTLEKKGAIDGRLAASGGYLTAHLFSIKSPYLRWLVAVFGLIWVYKIEAPLISSFIPLSLGWVVFGFCFVAFHLVLKKFSKDDGIRGSPVGESVLGYVAVLSLYMLFHQLGHPSLAVLSHLFYDAYLMRKDLLRPFMALLDYLHRKTGGLEGVIFGWPMIPMMSYALIDGAVNLHTEWNAEEELGDGSYLLPRRLVSKSRFKGPEKYLYGLRDLLRRLSVAWMVSPDTTMDGGEEEGEPKIASLTLPPDVTAEPTVIDVPYHVKGEVDYIEVMMNPSFEARQTGPFANQMRVEFKRILERRQQANELGDHFDALMKLVDWNGGTDYQRVHNLIEILSRQQFEEDFYFYLIVRLSLFKSIVLMRDYDAGSAYIKDEFIGYLNNILSAVIYHVGKGCVKFDRQQSFTRLMERLAPLSSQLEQWGLHTQFEALQDMETWEKHFGQGWQMVVKYEDPNSSVLHVATNYVYQKIMEVKEAIFPHSNDQQKLWDDPLSVFELQKQELGEAGINFIPDSLTDYDPLQFQLAFLERAAKEGFEDILIISASRYLGLPRRSLASAIGHLALRKVKEFIETPLPDDASDDDLLSELQNLIGYEEPEISTVDSGRSMVNKILTQRPDPIEQELNHRFLVGLRKLRSKYPIRFQFSYRHDAASPGEEQNQLGSVSDKKKVVVFGRLSSAYMDWGVREKKFIRIEHRHLLRQDQDVYDYTNQFRAVVSGVGHIVKVDRVAVPEVAKTVGVPIKDNSDLHTLFLKTPTKYTDSGLLKDTDYMMVTIQKKRSDPKDEEVSPNDPKGFVSPPNPYRFVPDPSSPAMVSSAGYLIAHLFPVRSPVQRWMVAVLGMLWVYRIEASYVSSFIPFTLGWGMIAVGFIAFHLILQSLSQDDGIRGSPLFPSLFQHTLVLSFYVVFHYLDQPSLAVYLHLLVDAYRMRKDLLIPLMALRDDGRWKTGDSDPASSYTSLNPAVSYAMTDGDVNLPPLLQIESDPDSVDVILSDGDLKKFKKFLEKIGKPIDKNLRTYKGRTEIVRKIFPLLHPEGDRFLIDQLAGILHLSFINEDFRLRAIKDVIGNTIKQGGIVYRTGKLSGENKDHSPHSAWYPVPDGTIFMTSQRYRRRKIVETAPATPTNVPQEKAATVSVTVDQEGPTDPDGLDWSIFGNALKFLAMQADEVAAIKRRTFCGFMALFALLTGMNPAVNMAAGTALPTSVGELLDKYVILADLDRSEDHDWTANDKSETLSQIRSRIFLGKEDPAEIDRSLDHLVKSTEREIKYGKKVMERTHFELRRSLRPSEDRNKQLGDIMEHQWDRTFWRKKERNPFHRTEMDDNRFDFLFEFLTQGEVTLESGEKVLITDEHQTEAAVRFHNVIMGQYQEWLKDELPVIIRSLRKIEMVRYQAMVLRSYLARRSTRKEDDSSLPELPTILIDSDYKNALELGFEKLSTIWDSKSPSKPARFQSVEDVRNSLRSVLAAERLIHEMAHRPIRVKTDTDEAKLREMRKEEERIMEIEAMANKAAVGLFSVNGVKLKSDGGGSRNLIEMALEEIEETDVELYTRIHANRRFGTLHDHNRATGKSAGVRNFIREFVDETYASISNGLAFSDNKDRTSKGIIKPVKRLIVGLFPQLRTHYDTRTGPGVEEGVLPIFFSGMVFAGGLGITLLVGFLLSSPVSLSSYSQIYLFNPVVTFLVMNALYRIGFVGAHPKNQRAPPFIALVNFVLTSLPVVLGTLFHWSTSITVLSALGAVLVATQFHSSWNVREQAREDAITAVAIIRMERNSRFNNWRELLLPRIEAFSLDASLDDVALRRQWTSGVADRTRSDFVYRHQFRKTFQEEWMKHNNSYQKEDVLKAICEMSGIHVIAVSPIQTNPSPPMQVMEFVVGPADLENIRQTVGSIQAINKEKNVPIQVRLIPGNQSDPLLIKTLEQIQANDANVYIERTLLRTTNSSQALDARTMEWAFRNWAQKPALRGRSLQLVMAVSEDVTILGQNELEENSFYAQALKAALTVKLIDIKNILEIFAVVARHA
ncbi:hypothetical protein BVX98_02850 [bacterium F11]|nr:hypothetical protein BVX98_02850 [bacterium F11]